MLSLTVIFIIFVESYSQLFIYSQLTNKKIPMKITIILPLMSMVVYLFFNYLIFVTTLIYFLMVGKKLLKECNNMIWFYSIYTIFSYAVFAYLMNSTILSLIGDKVHIIV